MTAPSFFDRVSRWLDAHRLAVDISGTVLALFFALATHQILGLQPVVDSIRHTPGAVSADGSVAGSRVVLVAVIFTMLVVGPLAIRRRLPVTSVVIAYSAALLHLGLGVALVLPADFFLLASLYSVTVYGPRWAHRTAAVGALVGSGIVGILVIAATGEPSPRGAAGLGFVIALLFLVSWAFALVRRSQKERLDALRDRADRAERERDQQLLLAAATERTRIARELHDIVAHSLSVMIAQADGGQYAATSNPDAAVRSLSTIAEAGRAALADMRRLLGVLRTDGSTETTSAPFAPQPGIDRLDELVEQIRVSGVRVSSGVVGKSRPLPPGAALTVYRVAQEALTNVLKHAGPQVNVSVMLMWRADGFTLEITDDGRGASAPSDGAGQGIRGMQERATLFRGTLHAGPRPGGGYRVRLSIPLPSETS